jgi:8-oxo-dGTP pyrophosphatase MutT (NUDIX family)
MAQKYKVYFANRPVLFTTADKPAPALEKGTSVVVSQGKMDTVHIESAINNGAKKIRLVCQDPDKSWKAFTSQFEFVQAAGGFVINKAGEALFIFRLEKWDLPKGKVEKGENLEQAAIREVEEECSIGNLILENPLCTTWHTYMQNGEPMLKATAWYVMKYEGDEVPSPQTKEGITDVRWLSLADLKIVFRNTYPSVIDVIEEYQKRNAI